ncbi:TMV resistance protein N [Trifolium repens]|nr:TMV resistance protein N [Trifolium repens]
MAMLQPPPSSSNSNGFTYDVFLSFRGPDTRYGFTGNLYKALCDRGIRTFIDDKELQRGDEIIPVLSINYASSSFCLNELVCIIHCLASKGRLVLPVFYGVEPSEVRHHTGLYGKDIAKHKKRFQSNKEKHKDNMERLLKWKVALTQIASLSGYHFNPGRNNEYEYEYEVIGKIVDQVSNKINPVPLYVVDYPVGLKSRLLNIISFIRTILQSFLIMMKNYSVGFVPKKKENDSIGLWLQVCIISIIFIYSLRNKVEEVTTLFARFLRSPRVQGDIRYESPYWRSLAANRIQDAWRDRKERLSSGGARRKRWYSSLIDVINGSSRANTTSTRWESLINVDDPFNRRSKSS